MDKLLIDFSKMLKRRWKRTNKKIFNTLTVQRMETTPENSFYFIFALKMIFLLLFEFYFLCFAVLFSFLTEQRAFIHRRQKIFFCILFFLLFFSSFGSLSLKYIYFLLVSCSCCTQKTSFFLLLFGFFFFSAFRFSIIIIDNAGECELKWKKSRTKAHTRHYLTTFIDTLTVE